MCLTFARVIEGDSRLRLTNIKMAKISKCFKSMSLSLIHGQGKNQQNNGRVEIVIEGGDELEDSVMGWNGGVGRPVRGGPWSR